MNKRTMKKGLAIVLALVMVFAMTATAFAATGNGYYLIGGNGGGGADVFLDSLGNQSKRSPVLHRAQIP